MRLSQHRCWGEKKLFTPGKTPALSPFGKAEEKKTFLEKNTSFWSWQLSCMESDVRCVGAMVLRGSCAAFPLLLRQESCHHFSPFVLDFCEPKGLEDFNGPSQRLRGPLYVKPQSHPRLSWPLFDFMKLILDRWYFYSSCLASPMAILM